MSNGTTFIDKERWPWIHEIRQALEKALTTTSKPMVQACYPREDYENADLRLQITVNLSKIRKNRSAPKTVVFTADSVMGGGGYTSDTEPNFAKIEISYLELLGYDQRAFMEKICFPLVKKIGTWNKAHGIIEEEKEDGLFSDYTPEKSNKNETKKPPVTLKCEVELESIDEALQGEIVSEPTKQKLRGMFVKATSNGGKCKLHVRSTLSEKTYDSVVTFIGEDGKLYVALTKDGAIEQSKSVDNKTAYRIVTEYLKGEPIDIDAIETEVLSEPPKQTPPPITQPTTNATSGGGCLTAVIIGALVFLFFILPRLL